MAIVNITVGNDADFYRIFQYVAASDSSPVDMTGASLEMMLRANAADATAYLRLGTDTGEIVITDPANGFFSVFVSQAALEQLPLGSYAHSNIMTVDTSKTRVWSGAFVINAGATR